MPFTAQSIERGTRPHELLVKKEKAPKFQSLLANFSGYIAVSVSCLRPSPYLEAGAAELTVLGLVVVVHELPQRREVAALLGAGHVGRQVGLPRALRRELLLAGFAVQHRLRNRRRRRSTRLAHGRR